jgi:hypothetical protein
LNGAQFLRSSELTRKNSSSDDSICAIAGATIGTLGASNALKRAVVRLAEAISASRNWRSST